MKKLKKLLFKLLFGAGLKHGISVSGTGLDEKYMYDFLNFQSQYNQNITGIPANPITSSDVESVNSIAPKRIAIKPIDVLHELETVPTPFTLTLLDEKIEMLKEKEKLIVQHYSKRDVTALIERLENRKKYQEFKEFFETFQNTTTENIEKITAKYDLVMRISDLFVPEFPDEAILVMKRYTEHMDMLCGKKPIFYVIATSDNFKQIDKRRDPILLVQSPFAFYWQILGAWDKEMLILSEL